jgi:hypothetical protein
MTSIARRPVLARAARALPVLAVVLMTAVAARAQDSDVKKYVVDVRLEPAAHAATVRATLAVWNPTSAPKRTLQFRIGTKSEVRTVTLAGQAAQFDVTDDKRYTDLKIVRVTLPGPIAGNATADLVWSTIGTLRTVRTKGHSFRPANPCCSRRATGFRT